MIEIDARIDEQLTPVPGGGILYDAARLRKPQDALFSREYWQEHNALEELAGGRSSVAVLRAEEGNWVLRHYRRGGFVARFLDDSYLFTGADRTRSFREWRLLAQLRRLGLPVPAPIAARYVRAGLMYRADLITAQLPAARTLAQAIGGSGLQTQDWQAIGKTIAAFHAQGVHHADLNAHNILLCNSPPADGATSPAVYLLDFDRGCIRPRGPWQSEVLARLRRSLEKVRGQQRYVRFGEEDWRCLMEGYGERRRSL